MTSEGRKLDESTFGKITDEEMERAAKRFGRWYTMEPFNRDCTFDNFEQFARGCGNVNPLFQNEEYAAKSCWGGLVAHPMYGDQMFRKTYAPGAGFPGVHSTDASDHWVFYRPFRLGDKLIPKTAWWYQRLQPSRFAGRTLHAFNRRCVVNQDDGKMVTERWGMEIRWERAAARERRDTAASPHAGWKRHVWSKEDLEQLWSDFDNIVHRGADTLYWEDVKVGDKVPTMPTMPYCAREIICWYYGAGAYFMMSNEVMYNYFKRHPGANVPDPATNVPDVPERTHYDREFGRYAGFPDMFDVLEPRIAYGTSMVTNWAGDDAFLREISMLGRRPVCYGDVCWIHGQVVDKYRDGPENLVKVVMCYDTQKWRASYGHAVVSLPSRERGPVVLPEAPSDPETIPYDKEKAMPEDVWNILYQKEPDLPNGATVKQRDLNLV